MSEDVMTDSPVMRVAVVDDSSMMRGVLRELIESNPAWSVVLEASDGQQAIDRLAGNPVDLIMLDIEMPRMGGLAFLSACRPVTFAPVIVVSSVAHPMSPTLIQAVELGAADVLAKPSGALSLNIEDGYANRIRESIRRVTSASAALTDLAQQRGAA